MPSVGDQAASRQRGAGGSHLPMCICVCQRHPCRQVLFQKGRNLPASPSVMSLWSGTSPIPLLFSQGRAACRRWVHW